VIEGFSRERTDGNATLMRLGIGNFFSSGLGALFTSVSLVNSQAAHIAGGRTRLAGLFAIVVVTCVSGAASTLIAVLPRVVLAALLIVTALRLFDRWTLQLIRGVAGSDAARRKSYLFDLLIILLVVGMTVTNHLVMAVAVGISLAVGSFILRMSRSIVRRSYRCDVVRSRKNRGRQENEALASHGGEIAVFELEGALFFGTADKLIRELEHEFADGVRYAILDLKRLNDIDSTAARLLMQLHDSVAPRNRHIALSGITPRSRIDSFVRDSGLAAALDRRHLFADLHDAIEWAEDRVIAEARRAADAHGELALEAFDLHSGLSKDELNELGKLVRRAEFAEGSVVCREGEDGKEMYLIARGSASVKLRQHDDGLPTRLVTFAAGTVFGEVALLDGGPRSATVEADSHLICYGLSAADFERLKTTRPGIAMRLLANLSGELGNRLRRANRIIFQLEH
jgi:CRP-like cAMP-binding protein/anti-anti-sigma regulatory factor